MPIGYYPYGLSELEAYTQALAAALAAWDTTSSIQYGPGVLTQIVPAGLIDFHFYNSAGVPRDVFIDVFILGGWRNTYANTLAPGEAVSNGPWTSDNTNVQLRLEGGCYCRVVKMA